MRVVYFFEEAWAVALGISVVSLIVTMLVFELSLVALRYVARALLRLFSRA